MGKNYISKEQTNYVLIEQQEEKASDGKSEWAVIDDFVVDDKLDEGYKLIYLKENHPEVLNVKKVSESFLNEMLNVGYETITGKEGTQFFTQRRLEEFVQQKEAEENKNFIVGNQMKIKTNGIFKYSIIVFNKDFTKSRVEVRPGVRFIAAKDGALGKVVELNKDYYQVTTLWLVLLAPQENWTKTHNMLKFFLREVQSQWQHIKTLPSKKNLLSLPRLKALLLPKLLCSENMVSLRAL